MSGRFLRVRNVKENAYFELSVSVRILPFMCFGSEMAPSRGMIMWAMPTTANILRTPAFFKEDWRDMRQLLEPLYS